jgi:glycosyltransferase involved in cell wall biosynthesis
MKTATIVLFTYKRINSLKKCLASLAACELAAASDLVIFSDAPKNETDTENVAVVRKFLQSVNRFRSTRIVERQTNMGVDYNIINGIKEIESTCEQFIILEDDVVFSENFLVFMNQALTRYQDSPEVLSVSGFAFVNNVPAAYRYDSYFTNRSWSWGWGSWSSKIKQVDWDMKDFAQFAADRQQQRLFNKTGGSDLTRMLLHTMEGKIRAWDIRLFYYQFKHKMVTLYPVKSKTINIGFTREGSNTFGYNRYKPVLDQSNKKDFLFPPATVVDENINTLFLKKNNLASRIKTRIFSMIGIK